MRLFFYLFGVLGLAFLAPLVFQGTSWSRETSNIIPFTQVILDRNKPANPHTKGVGDINGDGFIDILAASGGGSRDGLFWYEYPSWTKHPIIKIRSFTGEMQVGDVDGDGDLDVVISKGEFLGVSTWWYQNPGSATAPWTEHFIGNAPVHDLELGDVNKDGKLDVVARSGATTLFLQNSPTQWTPITINSRPSQGLALGDLDGDGYVDAVINGYWLENPLPSPITGTWREHTIATNWPAQTHTHVSHINGDNRLDVLFSYAETNGGRLSWYEAANPVNGAWVEHAIDSRADRFHGIKTADMDLDGDMDVVTGEMYNSPAPHEVLVYFNQGDGLTWAPQVVANNGSHNLRVADIGNDGDFDIIGANPTNNAPGGAPIKLWQNELRQATLPIPR